MVEELRELIESIARERARAADEDGEGLDIHLDGDGDGPIVARAVPAPPAAEAEIVGAEVVLGRPYPPELRALLTVANGFPDFVFGDVLLGTQGVGTEGTAGIPTEYPGSIWGVARDYIDEWYDSEGGPLEHSPVDRADCIPLVSDDNSSGVAYVVATSGPGWVEGTVVELAPGGIERFASIRDYLAARLEAAREA